MNTTHVVWFCKHCPQPIHFTADIETLSPDGLVKVKVSHHINAHLAQHHR